MTISNDSRARVKRRLRADRPGHGPRRPDPGRADPHRLRASPSSGRSSSASSCGSSAASSSSSAASSTCSTARSPGRPARSASSARSWTASSTARRGRRLPRHRRRAAGAGVADVPVLAAAAMGAAFMVSYARAKSEGLGFTAGTGMAAVGIMPREVRLVILTPRRLHPRPAPAESTRRIEIASRRSPSRIIAIGAIITVIQRILHVRSQAKQQPPHQTHRRPNGERTREQERNQRQRQERRDAVQHLGRRRAAAATARSGSPSSASATARAASSRAATTTRTPTPTTSSRA